MPRRCDIQYTAKSQISSLLTLNLIGGSGVRSGKKVVLRRKLNTFDLSNLVVGSIIGADIYVAAAIGMKLVGPSSLVVWLFAGVVAIVIALSFSLCATLMPSIGGPYAYVHKASNAFGGFIAGWSLLLAEWFSLAVFPVAFAQYATSLLPMPDEISQNLLKAFFILIVMMTNIIGIKAAGRFNDALTIAKLGPLLLLIIVGLLHLIVAPGPASSNFQPFVTGDLQDFGQAFVLIFWAYAGFELSTLPADEIERPERTIPKAIAIGMTLVIVFYMLTNFVIIATVERSILISSPTPLLDTASIAFGDFGAPDTLAAVIIGIGALVSILGADESGTLGTSRLAYAMAADGLMPRAFTKLHRRFGTPYVTIAIICSTAFVASILGGLTQLINASVFLLALTYLMTCVSALILGRKFKEKSSRFRGRIIIPITGIVFSIALMSLVRVDLILVSILLILVGIPIYAFFSPKKELRALKDAMLSRDAVLRRTYEQGERFLGYPLRRLKWAIHRIKRTEHAWAVEEGRPHLDETDRR